MEKTPKIGLVVRADNSGLGTLSKSFYKNLPISKVLLVQNNVYEIDPTIYKDPIVCERGIPSLDEIREFLKDIDVLITFETPYNWNLFSEAKKVGVKTILIPNYEWLPQTLPVLPDLFLCPSKLDYDELKYNTTTVSEMKYLPIPVDDELIPYKKREKAKVFVFNNGHGGHMGRNSAKELFETISLVRDNVKFKIHSQVYFDSVINDSRVEIVYGDVPYGELFSGGDVFIHPHKFDGLSLPIQEALMAGMPVISTDIYPHNEYLPKEWLFEPEALTKIFVKREIEMAIINPVKLAQKISEWANRDIKKESDKARKIGEQFSWKKLKPKYLEVIKSIWQQKM